MSHDNTRVPLDYAPMLLPDADIRHRFVPQCADECRFDPRPQYSQNPVEYGYAPANGEPDER